MKRIISAVCLILFGFTVAFSLAEAGLRIATRLLPVPAEWSDRPIFYLSHEASATLQEIPISTKAPGEFRVAVVGDSFTFAPYMQFDDAFPARLERWFNLNNPSPSTPRVSVINYGVPRYSTTHEVAVVERAIKDGADLVILQITLNDPELKPYRPTGMEENQRDRSVERAVKSSFLKSCVTYDEFGTPQFTCWFLRHSRIAQFVAGRVMNAGSVREYKEYFFELFRGKAEWGSFSGAHREIQEKLKAAGIPSVAVVFPLFGFANDDSYPFTELHEKVAGLMRDLHVTSLDLFEAYRNIPLDRLVVMPGKDRHPNEIGHRIAAEALYSWLEKLPQDRTHIPAGVFAKAVFSRRIGLEKK